MTKKMLSAGFVSLLTMVLYASPALAKHRHAFEGGFLDETGRIGAHAAVNLGVNLLGSVLYGSGLAYGAGGFPYGGPGLINRAPYYNDYPPVEHHHRHFIKKKIIIREGYPRYYREDYRRYYEEDYPRHYRERYPRYYRYEHECEFDD